MSLWTCDWKDCQKPAVQRAGDCLLCDRHLCCTHLQQPWHECPNPNDWEAYSAQYSAAVSCHLEEMCCRIDVLKLCARASSLRGIPCTVQLSPERLSSMMGNQNCHAVIVFEDEVEWLGRFRLTWTLAPPQDVRNRTLRSEAATLTYLQRHTSIPVPRVFDWACDTDPANGIGVSYILMEKLAGRSLDWCSITTAEKDKITCQLVDMLLEIRSHPFKAKGSLVFSTTTATGFDVQSLASHTVFHPESCDPVGPFSSSRQGWRAVLESYAARIRRGEIQTRCLADFYVAHMYRLDILESLWEEGPGEEEFFLKHPDDKGDHILVNDNLDIIGVIDWEWTQTVSKAEAFASPCMMWPVSQFYEGRNQLGMAEQRLADIFEERGHEDLANCVRNGRKYQRFFSTLGPDASFHDCKTTRNMIQGLREALGSEHEQKWKDCQNRVLETLENNGLQIGLQQPENEAVVNEQ